MATIGCSDLHMDEMTDLKKETFANSPRSFPVVKSIDATPQTWESKNVYNDKASKVITGITGVEVAINTEDLTPEDLGWIFGAEKDAKGVYVFKASDVPKTLAIMFKSPLDDQKNSRYTCYYKGKFQLPKEAYKTKEEGGVSFADVQIVGTFIPLEKNGQYKASVDSTDEAASDAIANWFKWPYGESVSS